MGKQRYQVVATYLQEVTASPYPHQYPCIMGYYDAYNPAEAFKLFLAEHAPNVRRAQLFYDDVLVIPVPDNGFKYKLSTLYGELAKFPNEKILEEFTHE